MEPNGNEVINDEFVISWTASDVDNDNLTYAVQYSHDGGVIWNTLSTGITNTLSLEIDSSQLPGSDNALVRVMASDGVNTGIDQSDQPFSVANKTPKAVINSPVGGSTFIEGQTIGLFGDAYDIEDGYLQENSISWVSDVSGPLGFGQSTYPKNLGIGTHQITMVATDSNGNQSISTISITVIPPFLPPNPAANPVPSNGQSHVPTNAVLTWTNIGDPNEGESVYFEVYLDTNDPPLGLVATGTDPHYFAENLGFNTTYYWSLNTIDESGLVNQGPIWSFTTAGPNSQPDQPTSPSPVNNAIGEPVERILSWSATDPDNDPLTYEVHLDTNDPPQEVVAIQSATSYDPPGDLAYSTTYYWQIIADDGRGGVTPGPVWSFSTAAPPNQPPNTPSSPLPSNSATNITTTTDLNWSATDPDSDPLTYEVRFGSANPPPQVVTNQSASFYNPPGDLASSTTYYWQIIASDGKGGVTPGPVWSFTTEAAPPQTQTLTLTPISDAYTSSANPTTKYGTATTLRVKEAAADLYSFLKFDTSALGCAQVDSATLRLYVTDASTNAGSIYAVDSNWTEGTITWNTDPTIGGSSLDSPGAAALNTWVEFDVTGGVNPGGESSFGIKGNVSDIVYYNSRESTRKPEMVIEYTEIAGGAPVAAFSATPLSGFAPLAVAFSNTSSGCPTSYLWNFGDGTSSSAANPNHTYATPGTYTVSLTAGNAQGSDIETKTGYITVSAAPPEPDVYISPAASATIGGIPSTPSDILRYTKSTNRWTMVYDGSVRGTAKNVSAFDLLDDGSLLLVFSANQPIAGLGTATPYDVVRFKPNTPNSFPLGAGTYNWVFQGKPLGLTTTGEKIDAMHLSGDRLLLSTTGAAKVTRPNGTVLAAADEDVFVYNLATNLWESSLLIDGSLIPGLGGEDLASIWDDPNSDDYYITIVGAFTIGGVKGNGKSIVKLTPNGGPTVYTPSLVTWLAPGATFPTNLDGLDLKP